MIIITDILKNPIDEGAKVATCNLVKNLKQLCSCQVFSINGNSFDFVDHVVSLNKLLLNLKFFSNIRNLTDNELLYIPESSATPATFLRSIILHIFTGKKITLLALQPRIYSSVIKKIIKLIQPKLVITQSRTSTDYLREIGIKSRSVPLGVDADKYVELPKDTKERLRRHYGCEPGQTILLHVGHIRESRNLEMLVQAQSFIPDAKIIIVGSTYSANDVTIMQTLKDNDAIILSGFMPNLEEIYNIADYYIFPVTRGDGAIETPLSVLEAMACNLPVITTPFGSLPDAFPATGCFHYVNSAHEIAEVVLTASQVPCTNRESVKPFTWPGIAKHLIGLIGQES